MPTISFFYGITITMHCFDNERHDLPYVQACFQNHNAVFSIFDGALLNGEIPLSKSRLVQAWIEIRREDLLMNWELASNGKALFMIEPLH